MADKRPVRDTINTIANVMIVFGFGAAALVYALVSCGS